MGSPATTVDGPVTTISAGTAGATAEWVDPLLLPGLASGVAADTVALFVSVLPAVPGWIPTRRTIVALAPAPNSPRWHIRTALQLHLPCDGEADTKVSPAGNGSRTTTPSASDGPALLTVKVYVALFPASAVGGPCLTRLRSAESSTAVVTLAVLLSGLGSPVADVTLAVLVNPVATRDGSTATMSFTVTLPPLAMEPRAQLTVVPM